MSYFNEVEGVFQKTGALSFSQYFTSGAARLFSFTLLIIFNHFSDLTPWSHKLVSRTVSLINHFNLLASKRPAMFPLFYLCLAKQFKNFTVQLFSFAMTL